MRIGGQGDQKVTKNHNYRLASQVVGERNVNIVPPGIYEGFDLTVESTSQVRVHPGTLEIQDERGSSFPHQIRTETTSEFVVDSVTETNPYIVAWWHFEEVTDADGDADNYVSFESSSWPTNSYWLVLGKGEFDANGDLTGIDQTVRTRPRSNTVENFDYVIEDQEDVHEAFENPDYTHIYVDRTNGPYELYHTRLDRDLDLQGEKRVVGDHMNDTDQTTPHFTSPTSSVVDMLKPDTTESLTFQNLSIEITNASRLVTTANGQVTGQVRFSECYIEGTSTNTDMTIVDATNGIDEVYVQDCTFRDWPSAPITGLSGVDTIKWSGNTTENVSAGWTDNRDLRVVNGSRSDADTVDGHPVTRATTFDSAGSDELLPKDLIEVEIFQQAEGFEGSVTDVSGLPQATNTDGGAVYSVEEDSFSSGRSDVVASGGSIEYPAGFWVAVDTDGDETANEWQLMTKEQTDITRDEINELKPSPTSPPSLDVLIQDGPYTESTNSQTGDRSENTVSISTPSSDARIDVISIDDSFNINVSQGAVATNPVPPLYPDGEMVLAEVKVSANTTAIDQYIDEKANFDSFDQGIRDVRPLFSLGGGSSSGGSGQAGQTDDTTGTLPAGDTTITLPFSARSKSNLLVILGGTPQSPDDFALNVDGDEVSVGPFNSDVDYYIKRIDPGSGIGVIRDQNTIVATEGQTDFDPGFSIENDGSDSMVWRNTGFQIQGASHDYVIQGGLVRFNQELSDGEKVTIVGFSGDTEGKGGVINEDNGTLADGEDTISLPFAVSREDHLIVSLDKTLRSSDEYTLISDTDIQFDSPVSGSTDYYVKAINPGNGRGGIVQKEIIVASQGQTTFDPSFAFQSDGLDLEVKRNGNDQYKGSDHDYTIQGGQVVFNSGLNDGDKLKFTQHGGGAKTATHGNEDHSPIMVVRDQMRNYLEPGGGVISNNGSNPNTQIDNSSIKLWVRDFSGGGRIVELPARSPAFDITISGFNGTTGGLINGSGRNATDWYEFAVIASESDDTLDPIVVGYTIESTDNTPQSASDLPGNYDLFRPLAQDHAWFLLTDGNSDIRPFKHSADGNWIPDFDLTDLGSILDTNSPATSATSLDISNYVPPIKVHVDFSRFFVQENSGSGASVASLSHRSYSSPEDGQAIANSETNSRDTIHASIENVENQEVFYQSSSADRVIVGPVSSIRVAG